MRNKMLSLILAAALVLALCACGGTTEPAAAESAPAGEGGGAVLPDAGLHQQEEAETEDPAVQARRDKAMEYLEHSVDELLEALGEPLERSYAPSCLGDGEDGELQYEGFTVYTYREDGVETVTDVK